ncbi:MAG TPA: NAD(P)-binding domain-containing protein, partial [Candidatus Thalassarchaeaceae archaeon]|nr:NAD(P)-binding domain-containing protein [Candidatus Thalassarchaeaceae archaeon]
MGWDDTFASRLINRDLTIGVIGLGYVGLPTALGFLDAGFRVRGVDVTQRVIDALSRGENPGDDPQHDDIIPQSQNENWLVSTNSADLV